jgi:secreted trypsin-like serine protease
MRTSIALLILAAVLVSGTGTADAQKEITPFKRRIVGGDQADIKQHPWQVALNIKVSNSTMLCGGSMLQRQGDQAGRCARAIGEHQLHGAGSLAGD